ncbi:ABC transporter substrate-binding protein [Marinitenerispora sediminis]|uniref:ABC transporter substrate-binding protein n=1 Tax=Marinitenerispora sediminis TaxID=1931232 RepID=UPI001314ADDE|nr:ABC transporter substrate-binding protein [Marinitenerispora sediminis]
MNTARTTTRHRPVLALTAGAALALATACGTTEPAADPQAGGEEWTFSDGSGDEVTLPERPQRVVAYSGVAAALWDYGFEVVGVFGPVDGVGGEPAPQIGDVDTEQVETLSQTYDELNIEALAALDPDLIVTHAFDDLLWYLPEDSIDQIEAVAPVAALQVTGVSAEQQLQNHLDLAVALGVDPESADVTEARATYDEALARLDAATEANPDLKVLAVSAAPDSFFVGNAAAGGDLALFQEHGVNFPETSAPDTDEYEQLSWEEADTHPADLILQDARPGRTTVQELADQPIWRGLPAVRAEQVGEWRSETPYSYLRYAETVNALAEDIEESEPLEG